MVPSVNGDGELELYAAITAEIAAGRPREDAMRERGLDDERFAAIEERIEAAFSDAMDAAGDGVPPFIQRYEVAMREAHEAARSSEAPMPLADFARVMRVMEGGRDPKKELDRLGLSAADVARAVSHYGPRLAREPALVVELERLKRGAPPEG